jgi:medium-chain acyl-[acyl-carrier-protein] hydrolase
MPLESYRPEALTSRMRWFSGVQRRSAPRTRLFCFPYAGGSARTYARWSEHLPADVEVWPVELPGRWSRMAEPPFRSMWGVTRTLADILAPFLTPRYSLFGSSFGALVAFELAQALRRAGAPEPDRLIVAAAAPPSAAVRDNPIHTLPDDALIQRVGAMFNPIPSQVLADPELGPIALRNLRADLQVLETYRHPPERTLDCPILTIGGSEDVSIPQATLEGWRAHTTHPEVRVERIGGDHFFVERATAELLPLLARTLEE